VTPLEALAESVAAGRGLPAVVRAAAHLLDASLAVTDPALGVIAVAARSAGDERWLLAGGTGVDHHELRLGDRRIGCMAARGRARRPSAALVSVVTALIAAEVDRTRAPERASAQARAAFVDAVLERRPPREWIVARAAELGADMTTGGAVIVARLDRAALVERACMLAERALRGAARGALVSVGADLVVLAPLTDARAIRRAAEAIAAELGAATGHSRPTADPAELPDAAADARVAASVAPPGTALAFADAGAYRLLARTPGEELRRFASETVGRLDARQLETLEAFLAQDGAVAAVATRLHTHHHTVRYRLGRITELTGHDVWSSEGREALGLGLKAQRLLTMKIGGRR
jgi:sugar diacid utilization regulator